MKKIFAEFLTPARRCGPVGLLLVGVGILNAPAAQAQSNVNSSSDHRVALSALGDIKQAIHFIVDAEDNSTTGPDSYKMNAQRAINALVGHDDAAYHPVSGESSDEAGATGNINHLLDRVDAPPWVPALHGALANIGAAVARLQDAEDAKGLMEYQIAVSQALINLEVAEGRESDAGVFGGMEGAIANTALAVPEGAKIVDGCATPKAAPAYGIHAGYLLFRTARLGSESTWTIHNPGGTTISSHDGVLIFSLPASARVHQLCAAPSKPE